MRLYSERASTWLDGHGYVPVCPICDQPFDGTAPQMHEVLLTRGDVSGNDLLMQEIMVPCNCVLLHDTCHTHANSDEAQEKCIKQLVFFEGYGAIVTWLQYMDTLMRTNQAQDATRLVEGVHNEM